MRAISIKHPGSVDVLEQIEVPVPKPKQGELLIKVHTAAVNRTDIMKSCLLYTSPSPRDS